MVSRRKNFGERSEPAPDRGGKLQSAGGRHKVTFRHWWGLEGRFSPHGDWVGARWGLMGTIGGYWGLNSPHGGGYLAPTSPHREKSHHGG